MTAAVSGANIGGGLVLMFGVPIGLGLVGVALWGARGLIAPRQSPTTDSRSGLHAGDTPPDPNRFHRRGSQSGNGHGTRSNTRSRNGGAHPAPLAGGTLGTLRRLVSLVVLGSCWSTHGAAIRGSTAERRAGVGP